MAPTKKTGLARLAELMNVAPTSVDPEDYEFGQERAEEADNTVLDEYTVPTSSKLKQQQPLQLHPKYAGQRVNRRDLFEQQTRSTREDDNEDEDDEEEEEEEEEEEISRTSFGKNRSGQRSTDIANSNDDDDDEDEDDDSVDEEDGQEKADNDENDDNTLIPVDNRDPLLEDLRRIKATADFDNITITANPKEEADRGQHVKQQLVLWDKVMDIRIHTQRTLGLANRLPKGGLLNQFIQLNSELQTPLQQTQQTLITLLNDLLELQHHLHQSAVSDDSLPPKKHQKLETPLSIEDVWSSVNDMYTSQAKSRNDTIDKWSGRLSALGTGAQKKTLKALNQSIQTQLQQVMADKDRLLKRLHTNRASSRILGTKRTAEQMAVDEELLDDSDFYQQQLRELIETKAADTEITDDADPTVVARQWLATQQYRQKVKNRVDTRASKGRKIRYDPHAKLINFMVPVPKTQSWHNEMRDELFASLLGKTPSTNTEL